MCPGCFIKPLQTTVLLLDGMEKLIDGIDTLSNEEIFSRMSEEDKWEVQMWYGLQHEIIYSIYNAIMGHFGEELAVRAESIVRRVSPKVIQRIDDSVPVYNSVSIDYSRRHIWRWSHRYFGTFDTSNIDAFCSIAWHYRHSDGVPFYMQYIQKTQVDDRCSIRDKWLKGDTAHNSLGLYFDTDFLFDACSLVQKTIRIQRWWRYWHKRRAMRTSLIHLACKALCDKNPNPVSEDVRDIIDDYNDFMDIYRVPTPEERDNYTEGSGIPHLKYIKV